MTALEVMLSDDKVRAVLFNVFGGITRCDEVANGILAALERLDVKVPIVVRLDGTNDEEGRKILADAAPPNVFVERPCWAPPPASSSWPGAPPDGHPGRRRHAPGGAGHHRP